MTKKKSKKRHTIVIAVDECKGCGRCVRACPKTLIAMSDNINKMGLPVAQYKGSGCVGCGACFYSCPEPSAITVWEETTEETIEESDAPSKGGE